MTTQIVSNRWILETTCKNMEYMVVYTLHHVTSMQILAHHAAPVIMTALADKVTVFYLYYKLIQTLKGALTSPADQFDGRFIRMKNVYCLRKKSTSEIFKMYAERKLNT